MTSESKSELDHFFYKGLPYKVTLKIPNTNAISGACVWNNEVICKEIYKVEFCNKEDIEKIFIEKCKRHIIKSNAFWTLDKAFEIEKKGKDYILSQINKYLLSVPYYVYEASIKGRYGVVLCLDEIQLPKEYQNYKEQCSDGIIRKNAEDYLQYLLGEDWNQLKLFSDKYPFLKFYYKDEQLDRIIKDICCMLPFYNDEKIVSEMSLIALH